MLGVWAVDSAPFEDMKLAPDLIKSFRIIGFVFAVGWTTTGTLPLSVISSLNEGLKFSYNTPLNDPLPMLEPLNRSFKGFLTVGLISFCCWFLAKPLKPGLDSLLSP